jgi:hypothetical protein
LKFWIAKLIRQHRDNIFFVEQQPLVNSSLYRAHTKLVEISIRGKKFNVPENNFLLRCFQYLSPETISYGRYCWNEECQYCRVSLSRAAGERFQQALSCKIMVEDGMVIHELAAELVWNLRDLLKPQSEQPAVGHPDQQPKSEQ